MTTESNTGFGECVDPRARLPIVSIATEPIRTQSINENEEDIQILAVRHRENVVDRSDRPRIDDLLFARSASGAKGDRQQARQTSQPKSTNRTGNPILATIH